jgi:hypothetical protein
MRYRRLAVFVALLFLLAGADRATAFRGGHLRGGGRAAHHRLLRHGHHARVFARAVVFGTWLPAWPQHTTVVYVETAPYYCGDGVYYVMKGETCYVTVPPPVGAEIAALPKGALAIRHEDETYHYYVGSFYQRTRKGYRVVTAPVGATVPYAPKKAARRTTGDKTWYVYGGVYYRPWFVDGLTMYEVVARPATPKAAPDVLEELPVGHIIVEHDGQAYRYVDGDWFEEVEGGYRATEAPAGASVPYLPESAKRKGKGFVCEDTYYAPYSEDGVTLYRVESP